MGFCNIENAVKVSVIIPCYNAEKYIRHCLDSVLKQTLKEIEIICIDNASTDATAEILEEYSQKYSNIKLLYQPIQGPSAARNLGIEHAKGEYIGFVDADDWIDNNFYETLYNAAIKEKADIAATKIVVDDSLDSIINISKKPISAISTAKKFKLCHMPMYGYTCNKIYNTKALKASGIKFTEGSFYEDILYSVQVIDALGKLTTIPNTRYHYRSNNDSITRNTDSQKLSNLFEMTKQALLYIAEHKVRINCDTYTAKGNYKIEIFGKKIAYIKTFEDVIILFVFDFPVAIITRKKYY